MGRSAGHQGHPRPRRCARGGGERRGRDRRFQPWWETTIPSDRKSTRLNSSHVEISYAAFCLKKKMTNKETPNLKNHQLVAREESLSARLAGVRSEKQFILLREELARQPRSPLFPYTTLFRSQWDGPLVIKGILDPDDAREAAASGADGIVVSNHGGKRRSRQIGRAHV